MTMPIYVLLKQLITCQEDTQSFRTIVIIFLYIHSMPPPSITMVTIWKDSGKPSFDHSTPVWIWELIMAIWSHFYLKEKMKMQSREPASQDVWSESQAVCTRPTLVSVWEIWWQHTRLLNPHRLHCGAQTPTGGRNTGTNWSENLPSKRDMQTRPSFPLLLGSWRMRWWRAMRVANRQRSKTASWLSPAWSQLGLVLLTARPHVPHAQW